MNVSLEKVARAALSLALCCALVPYAPIAYADEGEGADSAQAPASQGGAAAGSDQSAESGFRADGDSSELAAADEARIDERAAEIEAARGTYSEDEMIVVYKEGAPDKNVIGTMSVDDEQITDLAGESEQVESVDGKTVLVDLPEGVSVAEGVAQAERDPDVAYAQPNYLYYPTEDLTDSPDTPAVAGDEASEKADNAGAPSEPTGSAQDAIEGVAELAPQQTPNDPMSYSKTSEWTIKNQWWLYSLDAFKAWDLARCDNKVAVAVFDTGFNFDHKDMKDNLIKDYAYDAYYSTKLSTSATEKYAHGVHVSGIVAARAGNAFGMAGLSYNANVLPVRVFHEDYRGRVISDDATIIRAFNYLLSDPDGSGKTIAQRTNTRVVNMSLGGTTPVVDKALEDAIQKARDNGVLSVASGGNGDAYGNPITDYQYPSDFKNVIAVVPLNSSNERPKWADYNDRKDIAAPGVDIWSTSDMNNGYVVKSGSSQASPMVASAAALLFAKNSSLTPDEVERALLSTATDLGDPGRDNKYGHGKLNMSAALNSVKKAPVTWERLYGDDALGTMGKIADEGWEQGSTKTVVLATSSGYWDALSASALAGVYGAPVLLTPPDSLSSETRSQIKRLGVRKVYIVGGTAAVSAKVSDTLRRDMNLDVTRLGGIDAADTSLRIAQEVQRVRPAGSCIVATTNGYYDALSAAPLAYAQGSPVLLTDSSGELSSAAASFVRDAKLGGALIVGGEAAVASGTERRLVSAGIASGKVVRMAGVDAWQTSARIAEYALSGKADVKLSIDKLGIADGNGYWDALTGAALCGKNGSVLLLVPHDGPTSEGDVFRFDSYCIDTVVRKRASAIDGGYVFGGEAAVPKSTFEALKRATARV